MTRSRRQQALYGEPAAPVPAHGPPALTRPRAEFEQKIREQISQGYDIQNTPEHSPDDMGKYILDVGKWRDYNLILLKSYFTDASVHREYYGVALHSFVGAPSPRTFMMIPEIRNNVDHQISKLESILDRLEFYEAAQPGGPAPVAAPDLSKVFVVHGHDEGALQAMARFLEKIGLQAIVLREQPDQGLTTIEKFEACASEVGFAVVLLTPDDLGGPAATEVQQSRARQNVIFELGYFVGSLGRGRACLLRKGEVEIPSDLVGVIYTDMDHPAEGWKVKLARELKAAQFEFDADKVLA
jgi:predicted nucleotide-binding protein